MSLDPDFPLVKACQDPDSEGFERAFEALYLRYRDRVYSIAFRIVGSSNDAMDIVQEGFSLVFRKIGSFRSDSLFSTWLFRLIVNCAIDQKRARRVRSDGGSAATEEPEDELSPTPLEAAASSELSAHIHDALQQLSPKLRAILVLRYLEAMSYEQLAETLSLSMGTVKSRLARAHLAIESVLRGTLSPYGFTESDPDAARPGPTAGTEGVA